MINRIEEGPRECNFKPYGVYHWKEYCQTILGRYLDHFH